MCPAYKHSLRNEYFLTDYLVKVGNFNQSYTSTALNTELYFDSANMDYEKLKANQNNVELSRREIWGDVVNNSYRYDFSIIPSFGFLGSSTPLVKNIELKLSFDRAPGNVGAFKWTDAAKDMDKKPLEIINCHAVTEWISSPALRSYFDGIDDNPIIYKYEEAEIVIRALEKDDKNLRIEAIKGGNLPDYIFAGVIPQTALSGSLTECSTEFQQHDVISFNITVDGHSVNGYPMEVTNHTRVFPMVKFLDTTDRLVNLEASESLSVASFKHNYLWSHKFEVENSSTGWIGIEMKLEKAYSDNMYIVIWLISPCALSIDKNNGIEFIRY